MRGVISGSDGLPESERAIRENSMPENRRPCPGVRGGAPGDPRDMAKVALPESQSPEGERYHPPERRPTTGAGLSPALRFGVVPGFCGVSVQSGQLVAG